MKVQITEVAPRDGLQNEKAPISTSAKAQFISRLFASGIVSVEATSFVSPKWVPQLGDAAELWPTLPHSDRCSALVPNMKGLERALSVGVGRIAVFTAASDAFTQHNINQSVDESLVAFGEMIAAFRVARPQGHVRGYLSTIFECPYSGAVSPARVIEVAGKLFALGVDEVSLGDTTGVGSTVETRTLARLVAAEFGIDRIVWHFHDTHGGAIANVAEAMAAGFTRFDSSAAGLGGCPYAPGAAGNVATEDLVYFCHRNGIETGIDLNALARASLVVLDLLGRSVTAKAQLAALAACDST